MLSRSIREKGILDAECDLSAESGPSLMLFLGGTTKIDTKIEAAIDIKQPDQLKMIRKLELMATHLPMICPVQEILSPSLFFPLPAQMGDTLISDARTSGAGISRPIRDLNQQGNGLKLNGTNESLDDLDDGVKKSDRKSHALSQ
ncbi:hypothetical protein LXL04_003508 [Taraxacum kok-saghyz]